MPTVATVKEIWRFPVKSMQGQRIDRCDLGPRGIAGDRGWAVRDERAGEIRGAKKLPQLLQATARYAVEPTVGAVPAAEITLPDGTGFASDAPDAGTRLSAYLGRPVTLWPLQPSSATEHYRRGAPDSPDMMEELRQIFGRLPDEPLPDLSVFPPEVMEFTSPLGTYFDAFPVHLVTTASLATLGRHAAGSRVDVRRFRPNFVLEPVGGGDLPELAWCGGPVRIGAAELRIEVPCARCVMTTVEQGDLPKDPRVLRAIVRELDQSVGVYATVTAPGRITVGDRVELG
jgi:hypothetical protein